MIFRSKQLTEWRKTHPKPRLFDPPDEGPFRTQGPKPPAPPKPKLTWRQWRNTRLDWLRVILFSNKDWSTDIFDLRFVFFLPTVLFFIVFAVISIIVVPCVLTARHISPCATDEEVKATKAATAPDGTPVQVPTSWCKVYKPGREGETP